MFDTLFFNKSKSNLCLLYSVYIVYQFCFICDLPKNLKLVIFIKVFFPVSHYYER